MDGLAHALIARGDRVVVVTNDSCGVGVGRSVEDGIDILRLSCYPLLDGRLPITKHDSEFKLLMKDLSQLNWDGVLINTRLFPLSLIGLQFARENGVRAVVLDHGSAYLSFGLPVLDFFVRRYEDAITSRVKSYNPDFYGVSMKSVEWLRHFGIYAKGVISNSIDAEKYRSKATSRDFRAELEIDDDALLVAFVGRLIPEKGIASMIEASKDEGLRSRDIVFVLAGDGPLASTVSNAVAPNFRWVGRCAAGDVSALLLQADVLCLVTRSEGFSTVLLEASACGTPSIVTDVGGARELIPSSEYGTIIDSMGSGCIVDAICKLYDNRDLLSEQSVNCMSLVEAKCSWDATAKATEDAFHKTV